MRLWRLARYPGAYIPGTVIFLVGLPGILEDLGAWSRWIRCFLAMSDAWSGVVMGIGGTLLTICMIATLEYHWPKIKRFLQRLGKGHSHIASEGVVHFGTRLGPMSVRMVQNDDTQNDINAWLRKHDLQAPVDAETIKRVFNRGDSQSQ